MINHLPIIPKISLVTQNIIITITIAFKYNWIVNFDPQSVDRTKKWKMDESNARFIHKFHLRNGDTS